VKPPIRIGESAAVELAEAVRWYEARRPGLGAEFRMWWVWRSIASGSSRTPVRVSPFRRQWGCDGISFRVSHTRSFTTFGMGRSR
jgi:hypothetical protein